ncbi:MAG: hypothetical protein JWQ09_5239 [Segetibacter sp.]|nr:hypothetical protein [Segetibacter sp.]
MNLVKVNLELYLPALVELIDFDDFPWDKIDQAFSAKWEQRTIESNGEKMLIEASIYDIIIEAKKNNRQAIGLLDFLNRLFEELANTLTPPEKILVRSNAKSMLKAFDSKYLNFVGEMGTLNNMIKSGAYRLNGIEYKLPNGKSVDFKLTQTVKNEVILVEIVNLHLDADRVEDDAAAIIKFLTHKLSTKMADKKQNLTNDIVIYLIPVLWGGWKEIKIYSDFFKNNQFSIQNTLEPIAYLQYNDGKNYFQHHFKTVSHLFDHKIKKDEN